MRSLFLAFVIASLSVPARADTPEAPAHGWEGLTLEAETELAYEPAGSVFAAGPTVGFTHDRLTVASGLLFSAVEAPLFHIEGRVHPFLLETARPYIWAGAYGYFFENRSPGLDGGIGLALSIEHIHLSLTYGYAWDGIGPIDAKHPLFGLALGWHL